MLEVLSFSKKICKNYNFALKDNYKYYVLKASKFEKIRRCKLNYELLEAFSGAASMFWIIINHNTSA